MGITFDGTPVYPFSFLFTTGPHRGERKIVWAAHIAEAYELFNSSPFGAARVATRAMTLDEVGGK